MGMLSKEEIEALLKGQSEGKKNGRNPKLKVGDYLLEGVELRKVSEVEQMKALNGQVVEVEKVKGYVFIFLVIESSNPAIAPGTKVDYYVRQNAEKKFARESDDADLVAALANLFEYVDAQGNVVHATSEDIAKALSDKTAIRGFRARLNTKLKQRKEDAPALKPGQEPWMWYNWSPSGQTITDIAQRASAGASEAAA